MGMREEFENDPHFKGVDFTRSATHSEYYESPYANGAWEGWQYSRGALVIELPKVTEFCARDGIYSILDRCERMIVAQGLKVAK